ncbi:cupin [Sporosarcina thermotolerans]|uniref:Cupin n=1 Tax=Sporosarcina thermotolerans TaxID=633404 RepID=A0AAW9A9Z8_9BACL|nr:cupin [Sporosarcina thermotolerans]MDW0115953.1 cupin [Sporosarcina thermotolerans]
MRILRLNEVIGKNITQYGSNFNMRKLLMTNQPSHVGIMGLGENGLVGYHEATIPQMLVIIEGEGWVRTGDEPKVKVTSGDVVIWGKGEGHETSTDEGMKAIVIESEGLDLNQFS